jgi:LacI family transcriptional regulator
MGLEDWVAKSRPTLKDIAAELNLSHPTVSRALADHDSISAETKARIREVANRLGYVANSGARMLRRGRSDVIGLLVPDITNEFFAAVARRLADDSSERGQELLLSISADDPERELALVRALQEARPSELIVTLTTNPLPETVALLKASPCIQFMTVHPEIHGPAVTVGDYAGARKGMEHLLGLGHRRIGFVGPPAERGIGAVRLRGLDLALQAAGVELEPDLIKLGPSTAAFGFEAVEALMSAPEPPTAIYLSIAPISLGGIRSLSARGVRIPGDLSVVVSGSTGWYEVWPGGGLTSTTLPMVELAETISALAVEPHGTPGAGFPMKTLDYALIERGSTAPLKA